MDVGKHSPQINEASTIFEVFSVMVLACLSFSIKPNHGVTLSFMIGDYEVTFAWQGYVVSSARDAWYR